jgi:ABC-type amino acid transport substrate-binding protein
MKRHSHERISSASGSKNKGATAPSCFDGAWKVLMSKMNAGHIDLLPALYYSEARAQRYNSTSKYLQVAEYIFARDDTAVTSENDVPGKTVALLKGSVAVDRFRQAHSSNGVITSPGWRP